MKEYHVKNISELIEKISGIKTENLLVFRGEKKDYKKSALVPFVYRKGYIHSEDKIYRESQRFNDFEFTTDKTVFDRLSRIQHYSAPTRLIDVSEDLFSAIYFAINNKKKCQEINGQCEFDEDDPIIYIFEIERKKIRFYDSDTVSVIANLAKIPLENDKNEKSKKQLILDIKDAKCISDFNKKKSVKFLLHEIKEEKPQFDSIINPEHLLSVQFVFPKLTNNRVRLQKGAFLLFGLNSYDYEEPIQILKNGKLNEDVEHPIKKIHKIVLDRNHIPDMKENLGKLGIRTTYIYPEIDKVSEYLNEIYNKEHT